MYPYTRVADVALTPLTTRQGKSIRIYNIYHIVEGGNNIEAYALTSYNEHQDALNTAASTIVLMGR